MIGFDLSATGSHGFKFSSSAWTEGDIWIANALKAVPKNPLKKAQGALVEGIEAQFKKLGQNMFWSYVVNFGMDLHLTVKGDFSFMYQFQASKSSDQIARELLKIIDAQSEDMGDQVTIHFANCFKNFQLHVVTRDTSDLKLVIDIDL
jgi:hypothetical protein